MNRPRKPSWNEVDLWLGFGRHNQGRKVVENILKTSGQVKGKEPDSFDFAHDVSSLEAVNVVLQNRWRNVETVSECLSVDSNEFVYLEMSGIHVV